MMNEAVLNTTKQQRESADLYQKVIFSTEDLGDNPICFVIHPSRFSQLQRLVRLMQAQPGKVAFP